ncbi:hypothetical protein B0T17DRAFT_508397 [Bombardia bombarda]|uniref:Heterokaryon incompatibility domain-containing protein n=1 Tax=Bombardia bombarda TaxID=252184 RepID=A0AA39X1F7_9PEZI|nr:hypothetical protein B0T17DRAFT_508397 [Bombardia bombarda]
MAFMFHATGPDWFKHDPSIAFIRSHIKPTDQILVIDCDAATTIALGLSVPNGLLCSLYYNTAEAQRVGAYAARMKKTHHIPEDFTMFQKIWTIDKRPVLPYMSNKFDMVYSKDLFHCVSLNPLKGITSSGILKEVHRVLKPGERLENYERIIANDSGYVHNCGKDTLGMLRQEGILDVKEGLLRLDAGDMDSFLVYPGLVIHKLDKPHHIVVCDSDLVKRMAVGDAHLARFSRNSKFGTLLPRSGLVTGEEIEATKELIKQWMHMSDSQLFEEAPAHQVGSLPPVTKISPLNQSPSSFDTVSLHYIHHMAHHCTGPKGELLVNYAWVDTCCIDKSSSSELTESIYSMFKWYRYAMECITYLPSQAPTPRFALC